ncbi:NAD-dependent epimerase [Candidatus Pacearchaeota archaeon CG10_big_fil_rev_8_21_14_0_10_35_219]|nr:SDR family NAD(P)-dependent oxidoreductase [Candidatus Pacearchaeota archaeon]OIO42282.1 MAG: hypothetical protein AUJ63_03325 [Candidatus Pacearchaeota archaeon CG1_02_35_32]PIO07484.1 MAG: NAD-dependent epimerase [Candidatus Pacearchaeota archaeon CG10_big_fil_rev_8_21_14_0_10_35_219]PIY81290.1 MAG: NAD-dependent epimerase [Candidatus Pacearchaeota archaeon CG_4_10_14_0_8_um_filter_35_169]PIZ80219.1 MAG: NAD-dependent epimerase [Candidatus Pacearchaeota archaeon CG_4_10_14_0_2_um_filter_35
MLNKKVLITGGLGFIGSNLAKKCLELGADVTILDNLMDDTGSNLFNIEEIKEKIEFIRGDIRDRDLMEEVVKNKDIIFNLAAQVSPVLSMENPYLDIDINCKGQITVLEACRKNNPGVKIIYSGTRTQTGAVKSGIIDENCEDNPSDIYGAGKLAGEIYHLIYNKVYGIKTCSLRFTNIYGEKAQIKNPKYGVINWMIGRAVSGNSLAVFKPGDQLRDILYINDAVDALILAAVKDVEGVFVVGSGKGVKFVDISKSIAEVSGNVKVELVDWPENRKNIEVGDAVLDIGKIMDLGWSPKVSLYEGLRKTVDFYRNHLDKYIMEGKKF